MLETERRESGLSQLGKICPVGKENLTELSDSSDSPFQNRLTAAAVFDCKSRLPDKPDAIQED
jgi:hypothetical protein